MMEAENLIPYINFGKYNIDLLIGMEAENLIKRADKGAEVPVEYLEIESGLVSVIQIKRPFETKQLIQ